jgi:hypothetical protein
VFHDKFLLLFSVGQFFESAPEPVPEAQQFAERCQHPDAETVQGNPEHELCDFRSICFHFLPPFCCHLLLISLYIILFECDTQQNAQVWVLCFNKMFFSIVLKK